MQTFTKITAIIISVIMMMGIFIFSSSAEATDDYTCINGEKHSSTVSQCNNCGAFIVEVGKTIVLSVTRFENSNQFTVASGKTYYFKVRAYTKTDSGTVYSAWSTVKSVKVK